MRNWTTKLGSIVKKVDLPYKLTIETISFLFFERLLTPSISVLTSALVQKRLKYIFQTIVYLLTCYKFMSPHRTFPSKFSYVAVTLCRSDPKMSVKQILSTLMSKFISDSVFHFTIPHMLSPSFCWISTFFPTPHTHALITTYSVFQLIVLLKLLCAANSKLTRRDPPPILTTDLCWLAIGHFGDGITSFHRNTYLMSVQVSVDVNA